MRNRNKRKGLLQHKPDQENGQKSDVDSKAG